MPGKEFLRLFSTRRTSTPLVRTASIMIPTEEQPVKLITKAQVFKQEFAALGTELPSSTYRQVRFLSKMEDNGVTKATRMRPRHHTTDIKKRKIVLRTMPVANSPTCSNFDLPDLMRNLRQYKYAGYEVVLLLTADSIDTNYKWVKDALFAAGWLTPEEKADPDIVAKYITIITDTHKYLANDILGLMFEHPELGYVPKRAVAIFDHEHRLADIFAEEKASDYENVLVDAVLKRAEKLGLGEPKFRYCKL